MKTFLYCLVAISTACMLTVAFLGPTAKREGAERANAEIEASVCGDDDGVVAKGWEEHCLKRASSDHPN
ncbi:hypothetical protein [Pseudomonas cannabina]|uniref:Death-on-curing protein n=1 Tax=Pseudomonas cannabina TaxID=86840 RepID=A0A0P9PV99_PSECA|nr:hypothetical protein [Pseudomonas cannabina]KAA8704138.1 hypothetical protein F4W70_23155 [Pseudomonas cannabina]KPW61559.1 hypothetical protein ALO81_200078 [Pseudomonas cannabina]SDR54800.1 hypothetical protein SAMN05216597_5753 [Pseudomonas cannabina]